MMGFITREMFGAILPYIYGVNCMFGLPYGFMLQKLEDRRGIRMPLRKLRSHTGHLLWAIHIFVAIFAVDIPLAHLSLTAAFLFGIVNIGILQTYDN
ncbi:MAG: hypothetical protein U9O94_09300, partial [Nanoarchaeota archaeon]|nr:hypothetical protein [Nanoarchaeota archaeon]